MFGPDFLALLRRQEEKHATESATGVDETKPVVDETKPAVLEARAALARATAYRADISVGAYSFSSNGRHISSCADAIANLRLVLCDPCNHLPSVAPVAAELAAEPADAPSATSGPNPEA
jgi:hypothetical protein